MEERYFGGTVANQGRGLYPKRGREVVGHAVLPSRTARAVAGECRDVEELESLRETVEVPSTSPDGVESNIGTSDVTGSSLRLILKTDCLVSRLLGSIWLKILTVGRRLAEEVENERARRCP